MRDDPRILPAGPIAPFPPDMQRARAPLPPDDRKQGDAGSLCRWKAPSEGGSRDRWAFAPRDVKAEASP